MKTLQIFDPAMCCSTGVCGPSVDQTLVKLAADVAFLKSKGVTVERFNLAHQPEAFTANPLVIAEMGAAAEHRDGSRRRASPDLYGGRRNPGEGHLSSPKRNGSLVWAHGWSF